MKILQLNGFKYLAKSIVLKFYLLQWNNGNQILKGHKKLPVRT